MNAAGDDLFNKAEYDKAIEKYKAAIKIKKELERYNYTKENLYEKNKTNVEKNMKNNRKQSMEEFAKGKITKARIAVVEEDLNEIIERQIELDIQIRTDKLTIFKNAIVEMTTKIENSTIINEKDKDVMKVNIREIVKKVERLDNKSDIEAITENVKELISGKITKARIAVVEEDVEQLIEQQNKLSQSIIFNKVEETKELSQIDANKEQTFNLIQQAMNNNDEELVLAGLTSLANDQAPTAGVFLIKCINFA